MTRDTTFMRAAARIGDLASPFYDEERQRDVWNEASAVGFQLMLWLGVATATVAVWWIGADAVPYALALLALTAVASVVTVTYAARLGVEVDEQHVDPLRLLPYVILLAALAGGVARAAATLPRDSTWESLRYGFTIGATIGLVGAVGGIAVWLVRRRTSRGAPVEG